MGIAKSYRRGCVTRLTFVSSRHQYSVDPLGAGPNKVTLPIDDSGGL